MDGCYSMMETLSLPTTPMEPCWSVWTTNMEQCVTISGTLSTLLLSALNWGSLHLVSIDTHTVITTALPYTNIPQDEGTEACLDATEASEISHIPRDVLRQLFEIVLRCNEFSFDDSTGRRHGSLPRCHRSF